MKRHFRDVFVPEYYCEILFARMQSMKQQSKTIAEYLDKLKLCLLHCGLEVNDELLEHRFLQGLNVEIQNVLVDKHYKTFDELFDLTCASETTLKKDLTNNIEACVFQITNNLQQVDGNIQMKSKQFEIGGATFKERVNLAAPTLFEKSTEGKSDGCNINQGEHALSTNLAIIDESIMEPVIVFPLSYFDRLDFPCDKKELCDQTSLISTSELVHGHDPSDLNDKHVVFPYVRCIHNEKDELKLISSLNTLGYIEFDVLCNLNSLEMRLFWNSSLPCFDRCSFYAIGKYNTHREYMVHQVYICSDLSTFVVHEHVDIEACANNNHDLSSFPSSVFLQQDLSQEGKHCKQQACCTFFTLDHEPMKHTSSTHRSKPRTVCSQEGKNDEDIIGSGMTLLTTSKLKVKAFHVSFIFGRFYGLMLHLKVCTFSFSELLTWINGRFDCIMKS